MWTEAHRARHEPRLKEVVAACAVEEIAASAEVLIRSLVTNAQSRSREVEAAKAKERSAMRFRRVE